MSNLTEKYASVVGDAVYELTNMYLPFDFDNSGIVTFTTDLSNAPTQEAITKKIDELFALLPLQELRIERNKLLSKTDWTQSRDLTLDDDDKWVSYRQSLRDLPCDCSGVEYDIDGNLTNVVFPEKP
tara:strand:- start:322 stop:702 length:381 start_codon:yes stop_codon:yes gene_type:complete